jgi:hypothetical protein
MAANFVMYVSEFLIIFAIKYDLTEGFRTPFNQQFFIAQETNEDFEAINFVCWVFITQFYQ